MSDRPLAEPPLTAADCAKRTGVTVKALRVYERHGLIGPMRSASGWRLYGESELIRLNAISALKSLGLSLAQIRKTLDAAPPELPRVLKMQLDAWRARKATASKAIDLVTAALARLDLQQSLSVDDLCTLVRSIEMKDLVSVSRAILNEEITPEEEREWHTFNATLPAGEIELGREDFESMRTVALEFRKLMERNVDPAGPEAQHLVERANAHVVARGLREKGLKRLEWNATIARKTFAYGQRLLERIATEGETAEKEGELGDYMYAARAASKLARAFAPLVEEAKALRDSRQSATSPAARDLARRFRQTCHEYGLGDPLVHAQWTSGYGHVRVDSRWRRFDEATVGAWDFLAEAIRGAAAA